MARKGSNNHKFAFFAFALILLFSGVIFARFFKPADAAQLENDVRVEENSELKYFLSVKYDGVDRTGAESSESTTVLLYNEKMSITDKIPDGLTFVGFVTSPTGEFGAVKQDNSGACPGHVIDDTQEESVDTGTWDTARENYYYHGLHYSETTREVTFETEGLQAGCKINVGIITRTPFLGDAMRKDFYNTAVGQEDMRSWNSNTVHVWMGRENARLYKVTYTYAEGTPSNAPALPAETSYEAGTTISIAKNPELKGYTFSGWTTEDAEIEDGTFDMPAGDVVLVGSFTEDTNYKEYSLRYEVTGDVPDGFAVPASQKAEPGTRVTLADTPSGYDGYDFEGWTVEADRNRDQSIIMPENNIVATGVFSREKYNVHYIITGDVLPDGIESMLPSDAEYHEGDIVSVANNLEIDGYIFSGWSTGDFTMPANDVEIHGSFLNEADAFKPKISMKITNPQDKYKKGETVLFDITVENTANYEIIDVILQELLDGAVFVEGEGYTLTSDTLAKIPSIPANGSIVVKAKFEVTKDGKNHFVNKAKLVSALAEEPNYLAPGSYEAEAPFDTDGEGEPDDGGNPGTSVGGIATIIGCGIVSVITLGFLLFHLFTKRRGEMKIVGKVSGATLAVAAISFGIISLAHAVFASDLIPVSSSEVTSEELDYEGGEGGAWKESTTSAFVYTRDQISFGLEFDSNDLRDSRPRDVLIVLDDNYCDGSACTSNLAKYLAQHVLSDSNNRVGLIVRNETEQSHSLPFGQDYSAIENAINNDSTSSHLAASPLSGVVEYLEDYETSDERNLIVVTISYYYFMASDAQASAPYSDILHEKYPNITINAVQLDWRTIKSEAEPFSDNQYQIVDDLYGLEHNLDSHTFILGPRGIDEVAAEEITNSAKPIDSIRIETVFNDEYFDFTESNARKARGEGDSSQVAVCVTGEGYYARPGMDVWDLSYENGAAKAVLTLTNIPSFSRESKIRCGFMMKFKEGTYPNESGEYPVVKSQKISVTTHNDEGEEISETIAPRTTPVVRDRYYVRYHANAPSDCTPENVPADEERFIFDDIEYAQNITCGDYNLNEMSVIDDDMARYKGTSFKMPQQDVNIDLSWSKVSIDKSMDGEVFEVKPAYLIPGPDFRSKALALGGAIGAIRRASELPASLDISDPKYKVSTDESEIPVYIWTEQTGTSYPAYTLFYYTTANTIYANPNSSQMFGTQYSSLLYGPGPFELLSDLDTSLVTNMDYMLVGATANYGGGLASSNAEELRYWDTSNVTSMIGIFSNSKLGTGAGIHDWDVSNVTTLRSAFSSTTITDSSSLEDWNTESVTDMYYAFASTAGLKDLRGLHDWDISNVTDMYYAFAYMPDLETADGLEGWNNLPSGLNSLQGLFSQSRKLNDVSALKHWDTSHIVYMYDVFSSTESLESVDLEWDTSNVTIMNWMFNYSGLTTLNGLEYRLVTPDDGRDPFYAWDTSSVERMQELFAGTKITDTNALIDWKTQNVKSMEKMFTWSTVSDLSGLENWDVRKVESFESFIAYTENVENLHGLEKWKPKVISSMFRDAHGLKNVDALENWDVSQIESFSGVFQDCTSLSNLDGLAKWDTSSATSFNTFLNYTAATSIDALEYKLVTPEEGNPYYAWDMSNVTNVHWMFYGMSALNDISALASWNNNVSNFESLNSLFYGTTSLQDISPLAGWNINVANNYSSYLNSTFSNSGITSVEALRNWNVTGITELWGTFSYTPNLINLNGLDSWSDKIGSLTAMHSTFERSGLQDATAINNWTPSSGLQNFMTTYAARNTFSNTPARTSHLLPSWWTNYN